MKPNPQMINDPAEKKVLGIDDLRETTGTLWDKVARAKAEGKEYVETTRDVINTILPQGTGEPGYFLFHGIRVYETGTREKIEKFEKRNLLNDVLEEEGTMI